MPQRSAGEFRSRFTEFHSRVAALVGATALPLNVDAERCFADAPQGVAETVGLIAAAGAAG